MTKKDFEEAKIALVMKVRNVPREEAVSVLRRQGQVPVEGEDLQKEEVLFEESCVEEDDDAPLIQKLIERAF